MTDEKKSQGPGDRPMGRQEQVDRIRERQSILWSVVLGSPEKGLPGGLVETVKDLASGMEALGELLRELRVDVRGNDNGRRGLKLRTHDLENDRNRIMAWAKYIGIVVSSHLLVVLGYLLKQWVSLGGGG